MHGSSWLSFIVVDEELIISDLSILAGFSSGVGGE